MEKSRKIRNIAMTIAVIPLLAGCFWDNYDQVRNVEFKGREFKMSLAREYQRFAILEAKNYDWAAAEHFSRKALMVSKGLEIEPEWPGDWNLPEDSLNEVKGARNILIRTIDDETKRLNPEISARAYLLYDCWIEEAEENWQSENIDSCRIGFFDTMSYISLSKDSLGGKKVNESKLINDVDIYKKPKEKEKEQPIIAAAQDNVPSIHKDNITTTKIYIKPTIKPDNIIVEKVEKVENKTLPEAAKPKLKLNELEIKTKANDKLENKELENKDELPRIVKPKLDAPTATNKIIPAKRKPSFDPDIITETNYAILFDFDSSRVNKSGQDIVREVAKSLENKKRSNDDYEIILSGYADSIGDKEYNKKLSKKRAYAVKDMLVENGISKGSIKINSLGVEENKKLDKISGHSAKRKVEIFIK